MSEAAPLLRMEGIGKSFGGRPVLRDVSFTLARGEIHALLGENGAGKSTLMNVLAGIYAPDSGRIAIDGRAVSIRRPRAAARLGIGMVHQHFRLVPEFTAASTGGDFSLSSLNGRKLVLYFYPKDNTPGCTTESTDFRDRIAEFREAGAEVIGVSPATVKREWSMARAWLRSEIGDG